MNLKELRNKVEQEKGKKIQAQTTIDYLHIEQRIRKASLRRHEKALEVIRIVGMETQKQLQYHISDITSLALEAVFPNPYELVVEFVQRRNKTECDLYFVRNGNKVDPLEASGIGAVDVATFALRVAAWSMRTPRTRNTIILDEPFRFLSEDFQEQASTMLKEVSEKLGIQFIIVTHEQVLASYADKVFVVKKNKKTERSKVSTYEKSL